MRNLIIYSSKTGNTKKVAYGMYEGLKDKYDIDIKDMASIKDISEVDEYDTLLVGFWVDRGTANSVAKKFIQKIKNKNVGLFCTLGANPDSKHGNDVTRNLNTKLLDKSNKLIEVGLYNGLVDIALLNKLKEKPPLFLPKFILKKMIYEGNLFDIRITVFRSWSSWNIFTYTADHTSFITCSFLFCKK